MRKLVQAMLVMIMSVLLAPFMIAGAIYQPLAAAFMVGREMSSETIHRFVERLKEE